MRGGSKGEQNILLDIYFHFILHSTRHPFYHAIIPGRRNDSLRNARCVKSFRSGGAAAWPEGRGRGGRGAPAAGDGARGGRLPAHQQRPRLPQGRAGQAQGGQR